MNKPGPIGKEHLWTDRHTPWKGIGAKQFASSWRATFEHCEPTRHQQGRCQTQSTCHHLFKKPEIYRYQRRQLKREKKEAEGTQFNSANNSKGTTNSITKNNYKNNNKNCLAAVWNIWENKPIHGEISNSIQCCKHTSSPEQKTGRTEPGPTKRRSKKCKWQCSIRSLNTESEMPSVYHRAVIDKTEITRKKTLTIREVTCHQPP